MAEEVKSGYKTTEFWLSFVAMLIGFLMASGFVADGSGTERAVAAVAAALAAAGYSVSRGKAKAGPG